LILCFVSMKIPITVVIYLRIIVITNKAYTQSYNDILYIL